MSEAASIDGWGLASSLLWVGLAVALGGLLRLGVERRMLWAALRATVQLALVGELLAYVLEGSFGWTAAAAASLMIAAAAREAVTRPERRLPGANLGAFVTLGLVGLLTVHFWTHAVLRLEHGSAPRYVIPLLGMVLGNTLTGIALALDQILEAVERDRADIEADLAAGASRWEAMRDPLRTAVRRGLTPILNTTSVVGLVSLPGMMTGQILAGADPRDAVRYQLVVMFGLLGATALGCSLMSIGVLLRVTDAQHRLRG